jgi:hypothetical protein
MSLKAVKNTHLGGYALKNGDVVPAHVLEKAGEKNVADLLAAGFLVEVSDSKGSADAEAVSADADADEPKPKKGKK